MSTLLDAWNSYLDERSLELLQSAQEIADTQAIETNILHILFVALTHNKLPIQAILLESMGEKQLQALITDIQKLMGNDTLHLRLEMYKMACVEQAQQQQTLISDALILLQIFEKSYTVEKLALAHKISFEQVIARLQREVNTRHKSTSVVLLPLPSIASSETTIDVPEIKQQVKRVIYSPHDVQPPVLEKIDDALHSITCNTVLKNLERAVRDEKIVVLTGQNGSVTDWLDRVLAYRLWLNPLLFNDDQIEISQQAPLQGYKLWKISLNNLRTLYSHKRHLHPAQVLDYLKQEAFREKIVLMITGLETLSRRSAVDRKIKEQLGTPDGACILCIYLYQTHKPDEEAWRLGLGDTATMDEVEPFNERSKLLSLIEKYQQPRWKKAGFLVDKHAFDSLFLLEPGIWIDKRRKTFPYLAIDLADDSIDTTSKGEAHIRNLAEDAIIAIDEIFKKEAPITEKAELSKYTEILMFARQRIDNLRRYPRIGYKGGRGVITQDLIEAQLFCRNNSEFHLPHLMPWTVPL